MSKNARTVFAPSQGDSPALWIILDEAWRNLTSGVTRGFVFALVFWLFCGGSAVAQARIVVGLIQEATMFRQSGAAVWIMSQPYGVNGAQCDRLASLPGVVAAGAIRGGPTVTLAVLPSTPIATWEITPGFPSLFNMADSDSDGVWLSDDLAGRAGVATIADMVPLADGTNVHVAGVYAYPPDGRLPILSYTIAAPVMSDQPFDQCWVEAWPQPDKAATVLPLALLPTVTGVNVQSPAPTTTQLNSTHGTSFDAPTKFANLPLLPINLASILIGATLGFTAIRSRRLELACDLHMGLARSAVSLQILIETLMWTAIAVIAALPACVVAAIIHGPPDYWSALYPGLRSLVAAGVAALIGALVAMTLIRENHLFRYFKHR
ncbi:MAG: hypothetical protein FWD75_10185 [Propionibacteriaceae bacterium]|nr:hypothetical protein [Propionibacteriaceae bacterium]